MFNTPGERLGCAHATDAGGARRYQWGARHLNQWVATHTSTIVLANQEHQKILVTRLLPSVADGVGVRVVGEHGRVAGVALEATLPAAESGEGHADAAHLVLRRTARDVGVPATWHRER